MNTELDHKNPIRDKALKRAFRQLEMPDIQCLSLDIFDTLLYRHVPNPVDLFHELGRRLEKADLLAPHISADQIPLIRREAERASREQSDKTDDTIEITLQDIWQDGLGGCTALDNIQKAIQIELDTETDYLRADPAILALAAMAKTMGKSVILVSDTYFTADTLRDMLGKICPDFVYDQIFASCDYGQSKPTGLFPLVLSATDFNPDTMVHIGDNFDADIGAAAAAGMHCHHYNNAPDALVQYKKRENQPASPKIPFDIMTGEGGDFGLNRIRARLMRTAPTRPRNKHQAMYWDTGSAVIGPALSGYIQWASKRIDELQPGRILCLMREGRFLRQMMAASRPDLADQAEEFWASRHVLKKASVFAVDREEMKQYCQRPYPPRIKDILSDFAIDPDILAPLGDAFLDRHIDTDESFEEFWQFLEKRPDLRMEIQLEASRLRKNFVKGLRGMLDPDQPCVLVLLDLGYAGSIQKGLDKILKHEFPDHQLTLHGLYLCTNNVAFKALSPTSKLEGFAGQFGSPKYIVDLMRRSPELLEQSCMPREGSLISVDTDGAPILASATIPEEQHQKLDLMRSGIMALHQAWADILQEETEKDRDFWRRLAVVSFQPFLAMTSQPGLQEAITFGAFLHDENLGSDRIRYLADPQLFVLRKDHVSAAWLAASSSSDLYWPQAAAAMAGGESAQAWRQLQQPSAEGAVTRRKSYRNIEIRLELEDGTRMRFLKEAWRGIDSNYVVDLILARPESPVCAIEICPMDMATLCRIDSIDCWSMDDADRTEGSGLEIMQGSVTDGLQLSENSFVSTSVATSWKHALTLPDREGEAPLEMTICLAMMSLMSPYATASAP